MTQDEIEATKQAIEVLRLAIKRQNEAYKYGVYIDAALPVWSAANHLWRQLPDEHK